MPGLVTHDSLFVTRDKPPFAEATGDKPPRRLRRHPSAEGNLPRDGTGAAPHPS